jgi:Papain family cysteine protease
MSTSIKRSYGYKWQKPDPRDYVHQSKRALHALPQTVNNEQLLPAALDQGQSNTCGPHAFYAVLWAYCVAHGLTPEAASRLWAYYVARFTAGDLYEDAGVNNRDMFKGLANLGICPEPEWKWDATQTMSPPPGPAKEAASHQVGMTYVALQQSQTALMTALWQRRVFVAGINVYESFESDQVAKTGDVPMPTPGELPVGGHDIAIYGYDASKQKFLFQNSWSDGWGKKGRGTLPYSYLLTPWLGGDYWMPLTIPTLLLRGRNPKLKRAVAAA